jgi:uncharacterized phosphosugar-binding protein
MIDAVMYLDKAQALLGALGQHELGHISLAAEWCADTIAKGGLVHLFGSGHSTLPAREAFVRAGALTCFRAFALDPVIGRFERLENSGRTLLEREDVRAGEVLIVFSQSGINPMPIEVAQAAKERGLRTVAVTSLQHSRASESRHSSGLHLYEVADLTIDTHVPLGDASIQLRDSPMKVGPLSTVGAVLVINSLVAQTTGELLSRGLTPPLRISRNTPAGDAHNRRFVEQYGSRIPELRV